MAFGAASEQRRHQRPQHRDGTRIFDRVALDKAELRAAAAASSNPLRGMLLQQYA
ncbi:MAG TPA: hypothetical protein VMW56_28900 [Candidatus Margulisiibacteriota bacterium]|nr:hypothetical protein [Candidatus Margulisiibacteriota bacterium]